MNNESKRIVCYDTETSDLFTAGTQITQWASITYDMHSHIEKGQEPIIMANPDEVEFFVKPANLTYLSPGAVVTTGVTPDELRSNPNALSLADATDRLQNQVFKDIDVIAAFNGASFDKHVVRQHNFSQLCHPYSRGTQMDFMLFVKFAYAKQAKDFNWPGNFKLENLAQENGITLRAHDALEDVRAMVKVVNLIAKNNPEIWNEFTLNHDMNVRKEILKPGQLFMKTSTKQKSNRATSLQMCLGESMDDPNTVATMNFDKAALFGVNSMASLMYPPAEDLMYLNDKPSTERPGTKDYPKTGKAKIGLKSIPTGLEKTRDADKSTIEAINYTVSDEGKIVFDEHALKRFEETGRNADDVALTVEAYETFNRNITHENAAEIRSKLFDIFTDKAFPEGAVMTAKKELTIQTEIDHTLEVVVERWVGHRSPLSKRASLTSAKDPENEIERDPSEFFYTNGVTRDGEAALRNLISSGKIHDPKVDWFGCVERVIDSNHEATLSVMAQIHAEHLLNTDGDLSNMSDDRVLLLDKMLNSKFAYLDNKGNELTLKEYHVNNLIDLQKRLGQTIDEMEPDSRKAVLECGKNVERIIGIIDSVAERAREAAKSINIDERFQNMHDNVEKRLEIAWKTNQYSRPSENSDLGM